MDQLHEELKEPIEEPEDQNQSTGTHEDEPNEPSEPNEALEVNEADMLITDEEKVSRERQKEKNLINELHRADEDMASIVSSQGAMKHSKATGQRLSVLKSDWSRGPGDVHLSYS